MPDRKPRPPAKKPIPPGSGSREAGADLPEPLAQVARYLSKGQPTLALPLLLPELDARASNGDTACALAAAALRLSPAEPSAIAPDTLSATLGRLVALVRQQDAQIRSLRAMIEEVL